METLATKNFRFSDFELDGVRRVLLKNGKPVALNPKAFDLLLTLVESRGEVLSKDVLLERVWPGQFVEEGNLKVHISALRKIFRESKDDHRFIVTVPGRGYSFVAEVETPANGDIVFERHSSSRVVVEDSETIEDGAPNENKKQPAQLTATRSWITQRPGLILGLIVLILAVAGFSYWFVSNRSSSTIPISSIAVMPFVDESGNADAEYLSDGMTETLISKLAHLPNLNVKALASVFRYKGKDADPKVIGKELSVQAVLLGRVIQRNEQISLFLELVDATTGNRIWGEQYVRGQSELVAMQADIARDVAQKLRVKLSGSNEREFVRSSTHDPEAYRLYLKGRFYSNKFTEDGYKRGLEYFQKAVERDPNYALAHAGIAWAHNAASDWYLPNDQAMPKVKAAATRALEIDDSLAEGHLAMANFYMFYDWNWLESEREFRRSIELNPSYAPAHTWYGVYLAVIKKRFPEAIAEGMKAVELDPLSLDAQTGLAQVLAIAGQHDKAIEVLHDAIEMDKGFWWAHYLLGESYELSGRLPEAVAEYELARQLDNSPVILSGLGRAYAQSGKRSEALKLIEELKAGPRDRYAASGFVPEIYDGLGDHEQALRYLESGVQEHTVGSIYLTTNPFSDTLRSDPRCQALVKRVGLEK